MKSPLPTEAIGTWPNLASSHHSRSARLRWQRTKALQWLCVILLVLVSWCVVSETFAYERTRTNQGIPVAWTEMPIVYYIGKQGTSNISDGSDIEAIHQSFKTWASVDCANLTFQFGGLLDTPIAEYTPNQPNQNHIFWVEAPQTWPFPSEALAVTTVNWDNATGKIRDADLRFNGVHFRWSTQLPPPADHQDIQNTATHEIGHLLGLDHTAENHKDAAMYGTTLPQETTKRTLKQDDRDGICNIYPKNPSDRISFLVVHSDNGLVPCPTPRTKPLPQTPARTTFTSPPPHGCQSFSPQAPFLFAVLLVLLSLLYLYRRRFTR